MGLLKTFGHIQRRLQFDITTIFLLLMSLLSMFIIVFTYLRTSQSVLAFSQGTINRVATLIVQKTDCLLGGIQLLPERSSVFLQHNPGIDIKNKEFTSYLLETIQYQPDLVSFYAAAPNGNFLAAFNIANTTPNFRANSIVAESSYALVFIENAPYEETWYFYDKNLQLLKDEKIAQKVLFDPRLRLWYTGATKAHGLSWSDVYPFAQIFNLNWSAGITVSNAVYNESNELIGVLGADLGLNGLSDFIQNLKIGTHGFALILNQDGQILFPIHTPDTTTEEIVAQAHNQYQQNIENHNFVIDVKDKKYLVSSKPFPVEFEKKWRILVVDPLSDFFSPLMQTQKQGLIISIAIFLCFGFLVAFFAKRTAKPIVILSEEVDKIKKMDLSSTKRLFSYIKEVALLDESINAMRSTIRSFSRYIPKVVVEQLVEQGKEISLGGEKREITIMFIDIRKFSKLAEHLPLEKINALMSNYFDHLSNIILSENGTIDKYIGEGLMAFWGAPQSLANPEELACIAALLCVHEIATLHVKEHKEEQPSLDMRIGLAQGLVFVGNIGTSERMNYTAIGDSVNVASRLKQLNDAYQTQILVADNIIEKVGSLFVIRPLDFTAVRGRKEKMKVYELMGIKEGNPAILATPAQLELSKLFTEAFDVFLAKGIADAKPLFEEIHRKFPEDLATQQYLKR